MNSSLKTVESDIKWAEQQIKINGDIHSPPQGYIDANGKMLFGSDSILMNAFALRNIFYNMMLKTDLDSFMAENANIDEGRQLRSSTKLKIPVKKTPTCNQEYVSI